jgi:hypothetical protein
MMMKFVAFPPCVSSSLIGLVIILLDLHLIGNVDFFANLLEINTMTAADLPPTPKFLSLSWSLHSAVERDAAERKLCVE